MKLEWCLRWTRYDWMPEDLRRLAETVRGIGRSPSGLMDGGHADVFLPPTEQDRLLDYAIMVRALHDLRPDLRSGLDEVLNQLDHVKSRFVSEFQLEQFLHAECEGARLIINCLAQQEERAMWPNRLRQDLDRAGAA